MSIVSALSKLLVKMGGTPATGDNTDELVDKIADSYTPGGGLAPMTVTISRSVEEGDYVYTANKTVDEMIAQIEAGGQLFAILPWIGLGGPVFYYQAIEEVKGVAFFSTMAYPNKVCTLNVSILNEGSGDVVNVTEITYSGSDTH